MTVLLYLILICCITSTSGATFGKLLPDPFKLEDRLIEAGDTYDLIGPTSRIPKNHSKYLSFNHENKLIVDSAGTSVQFLVAVKGDNNSIYFEIPYTRKLRNCEGVITIHYDGTGIPHTTKGDFTDSLLWFYTSSLHGRLRGWIQMNGQFSPFPVPTLFREFEPGWRLVCRLRNANKGRDIKCTTYAGKYVQSEAYYTADFSFLLVKPFPGRSDLKQVLLRVSGKLCDAPLMIHDAQVLIRKK
uniref:Methyltransf_FA domain-containing protein n=1 Tax=Panagrellus redivivus TaxID=6233 RepID=A0A7E4VYE4_PANRE